MIYCLQWIVTEIEKTCLQALYDVDPHAAKELLPSRVPDTCNWIWNNTVFQSWLMGDGPSLLWVSGPAGCGKTMLSSFLVDSFKTKRPLSTVCFYFSDDKDVERNTAENLLRGIIYQILDAKPSLIKHVLPYFEKAGTRAFQEPNVLWKIFVHCLEDPLAGSLVCILDALDECHESGRDYLLGRLRKYLDHKPEASVKFLLTSRPEISIEDSINDPDVRLQLEQCHEADLEKDIERVVTHHIQRMPALRSWPDGRKKQLHDTLLQNSGKTFLWVSLVLQMLPQNPAASDNAFRNHLTNLPDGILHVYSRMLDQIPYRMRSQAKSMLEIIVAARRPLSLEQLGQCFKISNQNRSLADLHHQPNFTRTVHQLCRNFVRIINNHCYLVHQSAKEYLRGTASRDRRMPDAPPLWFHTTPAQAAASLAMRCMWYLNLKDFRASELALRIGVTKRQSLVIKTPEMYDQSNIIPLPDALDTVLQETYAEHSFLQYAIHFWADHFREAEILGAETCQTTALRLYKRNLTVRAHWLMKIHRLSGTKIEKAVHWVPPVLYCAYNGHTTVIAELFRDQNMVEPLTQLGYSTLHLAVAGKHFCMVDWLLRNGAEIEARDAFGRTPLHVAARRNDRKILYLLLKSGADVSNKDNAGKTPEQSAEDVGRHNHAELLRICRRAPRSPVSEWIESIDSSQMISALPEPAEGFDQIGTLTDTLDGKLDFLRGRAPTRIQEIKTTLQKPSTSASSTMIIDPQDLSNSQNDSLSTDDTDERISLSISYSPSHESYGHPAASSTEENSNPTLDFSQNTLENNTDNTQVSSMIGAQCMTLEFQQDDSAEPSNHQDQGL